MIMIHQRCSNSNCNSSSSTKNNYNLNDELVILVIGACTLDRSLVVPSYPTEDSKVRATAYHEGGGGNASNTAAALAKLSSSSSSYSSSIVMNLLGGTYGRNVRVKILSKVGSDPIGYQLRSELEQTGVDVSFLIHQTQATSSHTTILVSSEDTTRTCIHCPGTCGELTTLEEEISSLDDIFRNVIWVHFDTRHTDFSLALAKEAVRRSIPNISVDIEKDRGPTMAELINLATICFISATHLHSLVERTTKYDTSVVHENNWDSSTTMDKDNLTIIIKATMLCHHFCYQVGQFHKEVIVTDGENGSFHVKHYRTTATAGNSSSGIIKSTYDATEHTVTLYEAKEVIATSSERVSERLEKIPESEAKRTIYQIHCAGALRNIHVVDTTGAGDCFIAGFILSSMLLNKAAEIHKNDISGKNGSVSIEDLSLMIGSWVAGKKIGGLGTRASLPSGIDLDREVGASSITDLVTLRDALKKIVV